MFAINSFIHLNGKRYYKLPVDRIMFFSDYTFTAVVLAAWIYDHTLLLRTRNKLVRGCTNILYYLVKSYHESAERNEMIKPGYHVDFVYLYTDNQKIDITSWFRPEILAGSFKQLQIEDFFKSATRPTSLSIDLTKDARIEVLYTFCLLYTSPSPRDRG